MFKSRYFKRGLDLKHNEISCAALIPKSSAIRRAFSVQERTLYSWNLIIRFLLGCCEGVVWAALPEEEDFFFDPVGTGVVAV